MANSEYEDIKNFAKAFFEFGKIVGDILSPIPKIIATLKGDRTEPISQNANKQKGKVKK